jgi:DNA-binding transcriptional ArsR family regulator
MLPATSFPIGLAPGRAPRFPPRETAVDPASPAPVPSPLRVVRGPDEAVCLLHPLRRRLVARLREPASASALARDLAVPRQKINYHLRELEKRGLVRLVEERRRGSCTERIVVAAATSFVLAPEVLGDLAAAGPGPVVGPPLAAPAGGESPSRPSPPRLLASLAAEVRLGDAAARGEALLGLGAEIERIRAASSPAGAPHRIQVTIHPTTEDPAPSPPPADPRPDPAP